MTAATRISPEKLSTCFGCPKEGPAIYVACLASYNAGTLHGRWIDLSNVSKLAFTESGMVEVLQQCIDLILSESDQPGAEEWAIHDSQGLPKVLDGSNCVGLPWATELEGLAAFTRQWELACADCDDDAYRSWCDHTGQVGTFEDFRESFRGTWDSEADFVQDFYEQNGKDLGELASYIDWDQVWYGEFSCDGWWSEYAGDGVYWVFSS